MIVALDFRQAPVHVAYPYATLGDLLATYVRLHHQGTAPTRT
jgi:hypothetical protein